MDGFARIPAPPPDPFNPRLSFPRQSRLISRQSLSLNALTAFQPLLVCWRSHDRVPSREVLDCLRVYSH